MNIYKTMGIKKQEKERKDGWLINSKKLATKYGMSEDIFRKLVLTGYNPKKFLGAIEFKIIYRKEVRK